jgi:hypothetical protein
MATINLGAIKFKWQGAYNAGTAYTVDDVVSYNGSSYICILASTGNLPTDATYFEQMSQAGTDGTDLTSTLTTQGDILYRDGSGLQRLGAGTSGQVLQSGGTGANPSWTTVSSGGLKQIVFAQTASLQTLSSASFSDLSGVSVNITPSSSSNKVLIMSGIQYNLTANDRGFQARIMRDSTAIQEPNNQKEHYLAGNVHHGRTSYMFLDTPNTTSQITYKMQVFTDGGNAVNFNDSAYSYIYAMEVAV